MSFPAAVRTSPMSEPPYGAAASVRRSSRLKLGSLFSCINPGEEVSLLAIEREICANGISCAAVVAEVVAMLALSRSAWRILESMLGAREIIGKKNPNMTVEASAWT